MIARHLDAVKEDWTGELDWRITLKKIPPDLHVAHVNLLSPYCCQDSLEQLQTSLY